MGDRKAIFITGGGSGIGRAVALHFAERGWFVGLGDIDKSGLHETAELIGNGFVYSHVFDVRDRAAWDEALEAFSVASGHQSERRSVRRSGGPSPSEENRAGILPAQHRKRCRDLRHARRKRVFGNEIRGAGGHRKPRR